jgi:hypothetical protein
LCFIPKKASRTNSTFVFFLAKANAIKNKRAIFSQR